MIYGVGKVPSLLVGFSLVIYCAIYPFSVLSLSSVCGFIFKEYLKEGKTKIIFILSPFKLD